VLGRSALAVGILACVTFATPARSQPPTDAEALFAEGRDAARLGDWARACPKFAESLRLEPAVGTRLNLARCEAKLGRLATARQHFARVVDELPVDDDRLPYARQQLEELEQQAPRIEIRLEPGVDGAVIALDGEALGADRAGDSLIVDPGAHVVTVDAPGRPRARYEVTLRPGERRTLEVAPAPLPAPAPTPRLPRPLPARAPEPSSTPAPAPQAVGGWTSLAIGSAALGASAIFGALVLARKAEVEDHCSDDYACDDAGLDASSSGRVLSSLATASFVVGIAGIGTGIVLVLTVPGDPEQEPLAAAVTIRGAY
jgi:tetratricopeptide repeat protein